MNKINRILLAALAVQAVAVMGMRLGGTEKPVVVDKKILEAFDADKVTRIKISGRPQEKPDDPPQNHVELVKAAGAWGIADADSYPADEQKVTDFLKTLGKLRARDVVLTQSTFHKKLEVSKELFQRAVTVTQDGKDTTFYVGTSPAFKTVHVRLDGNDEVLLVNDLSTSDVGDRSWNWVKRSYYEFPKSDVWSIRIENQKGAIALERSPGSEDWISANVQGALDTTVVNNLVNKAISVSLEAPIGKQEAPEHGFDAPLATVTLVTGTATVAGAAPPSTETTVLKIGKKMEKESRYYAKSSRSDYVVSVATWALDPLVEKGPSDIVKKDDAAAAQPADAGKAKSSKKSKK